MKTFKEFNEGMLDFLSKEKREKRKKVKDRAKNISNIRTTRKKEMDRHDSLSQKFASPRGGSDAERKELSKLKTKHGDAIKKRADKMNKTPQRGG